MAKKKKKANKQNLVKNSSTANSKYSNLFKKLSPLFQKPKTYFHQRLYMSVCLGAGEGDSECEQEEWKRLCSCVRLLLRGPVCALYVLLCLFLRPLCALNFQTITETLKLGKE